MESTALRYFRSLFGGFPAAFWWLWVSTLVNWLGRFVVPLMAIYLTQSLGYPPMTAGIMLALFGAGGVVSGVIGGALADRIGRRITIVTSHICASLVMLMLSFADSPITIGILLTTLGLVGNAAEPATKALIADLLPPKDRARGFAANMWALNLGYAAGPLIGGVVAEYSYMLIFVINAAATLATAGIIFSRLPSDRRRIADTAFLTSAPTTIADILRDRIFVSFVLLNFLFALIYVQSTISLPMVLASQGFPPSAYGLLLSINGFVLILMQMPAAAYVSRYSRSIALAVSAMVVGIGFGTHMFAATWAVYAIGVFIWTAAEIINMPLAASVTSDLAPSDARGRYLGLFMGTWSAASLVAPLLAGYTIQHHGAQMLWALCAGLGVVCFIGRLLISSALDSRLAVPDGELFESIPPQAGTADGIARSGQR